MVQTPALTVSPGFHGSAMETPITYLDDTSQNFGLSDTHQLINSAETENYGLSDAHQSINSTEMEELCFLEADTNTPAKKAAMVQRVYDDLHDFLRSLKDEICANVITVILIAYLLIVGFMLLWAVAQYLKRHSPITPIMEEPAKDLNLKKILEGKTRKLSARMFFEVLVLKNHALFDVQQEEPYGDIMLKLTPSLSKAYI
ncbi:hypothetical protein RIF29_20847 [Crotalaria pallida]|uniref:Rad21/Rec8-like protein C-terminal eukaryotic domain-containing protein n=1 Tax=Crotalaria pallida TaxID=3830 RepID=A0AAN9F491_CROPI